MRGGSKTCSTCCRFRWTPPSLLTLPFVKVRYCGRSSPWLIVLLLAMLATTLMMVVPLIRRRRRLVDIRETASNVLAGHVGY